MSKIKGSRKFLLDGKPVYAVPQDVEGAKRWFFKGEDVTDRLMKETPGGVIPAFHDQSQGQSGGGAETPAYAGAGKIDAALAALTGARGAVQGGTLLETIEKQLQRLDSSVRVIKETIKGVEVGLRSISRQLHEADILHELALADERKRAADRAPGPREPTRPAREALKGKGR